MPRAFAGWQAAFLLIAFALLVVMRMPQAWAHGRFYSEEIAVFFAYAWHRPAGEALWRSFAGYLNLGANASTLLAVELVRAHIVALEFAPYVTMGIALAFQLVPAAILLRGRSAWLTGRRSVVVALLILGIAPLTEEVFGHSLHIQFHLALSAALVLALDIPASRAGRMAYLLLLALAPLCGPAAILLAPLYGLRAVLEKDRDRFVQALVLGLASAAQLALFYSASPLRGQHIDPATLVNILFVRFTVMPFLSAPVASLYGGMVYEAYLHGGATWWVITLLSATWFAVLLFLAVRHGRGAAVWLIASALVIGATTFGIGMLPLHPSLWFNGAAGERYNFLPLTLFGLGFVALAACPAWVGRLSRGLVLLFLTSGALTFMFPLPSLAAGPNWQAEVARWRKDPTYPVRGWPETWRADLSGRNSLPCTPPVAGALGHQPEYCESEWVRQVKTESRWNPPPPRRQAAP